MCTYLHRYQSTYYFRRGVPKEIQPLILTGSGKPRTEWRLSLRTKDREQAKRKIPEHASATDRLIVAAQRALATAKERGGASSSEMQQTISQAIADEMERDSREAAEFSEREHFKDEVRADQDPSFAIELEIRAEKAAELRRISEPRENRELLAQTNARAEVELMDLFDGYASEAGARPSTIEGFRSHIRSFIEQSGITDASKIELRHVIGWIDWLRAKPGRRGATLSEVTIRNGYLAALRLTLAYGVTKLLLPRNIMSDLKLMKAKKPKLLRERHFNKDERRRILSASLEPAPKRVGQQLADARRWVPWLCAYTGARVGEVFQLRKCDVKQEDGIWAMHLTPMAGEVKNNAQRWVPLHEHLIDQGFLAWVENCDADRLFYRERPVRAPARRSPPYQSNYNRLREWLRGLVPDPHVQPCHGWRHTFKSLAREYDMNGEIVDVIQGHSPATVGKGYGGASMAVRLRELEKLPRFEAAP